jgi:hypothetical protein
VTSVIDGADGISAPLGLLRSLAEDDLTASAVEAFTRDAREAGTA